MPCTVTKVPVTLQKCPFVLQKCLKKDRNVPFPPALSLSLPLFNAVFVIALLWVFFVIMCEGWGEVDSWKHRVVQLAPYILSSKHFFMLFYETFSPTFSTQNLGERIEELRLYYQIIWVLFSTLKFCFQNSSSMRTSVRISSLPFYRFRVAVMWKPFDGAEISPK